MSVKPSFITGASAKIKVGGKTFAYASDVSYNVSVDVIPVETMGRYEADNLEPVNYTVSGNLSIVRYTKFAGGQTGNPHLASLEGNGLKASGIEEHFNPSLILTSNTVDIEIFQKQKLNPNDTTSVLVAKIHDARFTRLGGGINKRGILVENMSFMGLMYDGNDSIAAKSGETDLSTG